MSDSGAIGWEIPLIFISSTSHALVQLGSLLLTTPTGLLLGFPHNCIPHSTEQMLDRQADRYTDGLGQTETDGGYKSLAVV